MPDLIQALLGNDLGFLKMIAGAWHIELERPDAATFLTALATAITGQPALVRETVESLPADAANALRRLMENDGKMTWAVFCRRFGELREMGPGRRDRERPDQHPVSTTEDLWYHALIGKAFLDLPPEPQEFAFIPTDLIQHLAFLGKKNPSPLGRLATPGETTAIRTANDRILDHACTVLSAIRSNLPLDGFEGRWPIPLPVLLGLLKSAQLLDDHAQIQSEAVRLFLEAGRGEALATCARAWLESDSFNELRLLPGLAFEGQWDNRPRRVRGTILELLSGLPQDAWWNLDSWITAIKEDQPDFQRPGGDYDSWFIREEITGQYLQGFASWNQVDGTLLRFMVTGPLHWLGFYDLASPVEGGPATAFRPSPKAAALRQGLAPSGLAEETARLRASPDGRIRAPALAPRSARYQVARFCEWESETPEESRFRLTSASLERARQQGLRSTHLLAQLKRYAVQPLPPSLLQALDHWEKFGAQASLESAILLRLASPDLLALLRKSRAARFLGEALSATVVTIKPGGEETIRQVLAESGYLADENLI